MFDKIRKTRLLLTLNYDPYSQVKKSGANLQTFAHKAVDYTVAIEFIG